MHFQAGDTGVAWEATGGAGRGVKEWTKSGRDGAGGPGGGRGREPAYTSRRGAGPRVGHPALWRRFASSYEGGPCTQQPVRVPAHISGYTPCQKDPGEFAVKYDRPVTLSRRSLRYALQQCVSLPQSVLPSKMDVQVGGVAATCGSQISAWYCSCEMHLTTHCADFFLCFLKYVSSHCLFSQQPFVVFCVTECSPPAPFHQEVLPSI